MQDNCKSSSIYSPVEIGLRSNSKEEKWQYFQVIHLKFELEVFQFPCDEFT